MAEIPSEEMLSIAAHCLLKRLPNDEQYFEDGYEGILAEGWKTVGETKMFTATAENTDLGLFGKAFSINAIPYAKRVIQAHDAIREGNLSQPVLPIIHSLTESAGVVMLFKLGEDHGPLRVQDFFESDDRAVLHRIAVQFGIKPLGARDKVAIVRIGRVAYATDIFDDSTDSIDTFLMGES